MFDSPVFLGGTNSATRSAAEAFKEAMNSFGKKIQDRTFDENGLCQGAPFIWRALNPKVAPFSLTI
jgi:arachidonate 15-lipoxygenase (second type)/8-lipoxygenase (S-type)